jgi:DNA (cytosine-5)-methyltransferase 1
MPRSVELFAGGGGMALGMHAAGFEHEQLVEINAPACDTLTTNAEVDPTLWKKENVRHLDVQVWLREGETKAFKDIDLIAGGPPCQPFSIAGARAGHADDRNMFPAAIEAVRLLTPKTFVFENVPGLLRPGFLPYYEYIEANLTRPSIAPVRDEHWTDHYARIGRARRKAEYKVYREVVQAANFGVAQTRKRVFIIGIRQDIAEKQELTPLTPTHSRDALIRSQWITHTYWETRGLPTPGMPDRMAAQVRRLSRDADEPVEEPWRTTRDAISRFPTPIDDTECPDFANHRGIPGARRYRGHTGGWYEWPAKTLKAGVHGVCGGEAMIRFTDDSIRYLTVREAAHLQTFPDTYMLPDKRTVAMRVIGNAVAADIARIIGDQLVSVLNIASNAAPPSGDDE